MRPISSAVSSVGSVRRLSSANIALKCLNFSLALRVNLLHAGVIREGSRCAHRFLWARRLAGSMNFRVLRSGCFCWSLRCFATARIRRKRLRASLRFSRESRHCITATESLPQIFADAVRRNSGSARTALPASIVASVPILVHQFECNAAPPRPAGEQFLQAVDHSSVHGAQVHADTEQVWRAGLPQPDPEAAHRRRSLRVPTLRLPLGPSPAAESPAFRIGSSF